MLKEEFYRGKKSKLLHYISREIWKDEKHKSYLHCDQPLNLRLGLKDITESSLTFNIDIKKFLQCDFDLPCNLR